MLKNIRSLPTTLAPALRHVSRHTGAAQKSAAHSQRSSFTREFVSLGDDPSPQLRLLGTACGAIGGCALAFAQVSSDDKKPDAEFVVAGVIASAILPGFFFPRVGVVYGLIKTVVCGGLMVGFPPAKKSLPRA